MSGKFLLDTNIVIALFASEQSVQPHFDSADEVFVPAVVVGERY
jgi:tRNA(fMet)-specific endonuclease VapC